LDEEFGTLLIRRTQLSLTEAGKVFLSEAERSLQQLELAKIAAQRAGRGETGQIAIGLQFSIAGRIETVADQVTPRELYGCMQFVLATKVNLFHADE
jgi:DNA-binding transcriptional LysR family regulator